VYDVFRKHAAEGAKKQEAWKAMFAEYQEKEPELAAQFQRAVLDRKLPEGWVDALPKLTPEDGGKATRLHSQDCLNALASVMPEFMGGSADLAPSNMTLMKCTGDFLKDSYEGRNMRFGIREFGMGAVANAISLDKTGLVPYCATFTIFSDYMRNAIRLAALAQAGTIFVTTHDSIAVGEDGPTHQPIETVPSLRMIPDLTVMPLRMAMRQRVPTSTRWKGPNSSPGPHSWPSPGRLCPTCQIHPSRTRPRVHTR